MSMEALKYIAGVDEAGRGPLAGPVYAAAVILDPEKPIPGLTDSKLLNVAQRQEFYELIKARALAWAVARAEVAEIDLINILRASLLAMKRAVTALTILPNLALIDGNFCPQLTCPARAIIGGDKTEAAISAASIMAKVSRDAEMVRLDRIYPAYGFAQHKGYGTAAHLAALREHGASDIHRRSFEPVRQVLGRVLAPAEEA